MADLIQIKGGTDTVPKLADRELAYRKDEQSLYIGTQNGNIKLCNAGDIMIIAGHTTDIQTLTNRINQLESEIGTAILNINTQIAEIMTHLGALEGGVNNG